MKNSLKALLCLNLAILLNTSLFATEVDTYEKVKTLFEESSTPATLDHFEKFGAMTKKKCMVFGGNGQIKKALPFQKRTYILKVTTPDEGPLSPGGVRELKRNVLLPADILDMRNGYSNDLSRILDDISNNINLDTTATYLKLNIARIPYEASRESWLSEELSEPWEIQMRVSGEYLVMKLLLQRSTEYKRNLLTFGYMYCWDKK